MSLTLHDAAKLSRRPYTAAMFKAIATSDEMFAAMPFVPKAGNGWEYTREKALPSMAFISDTSTSVAESTGTDEIVVVHQREAASDFYVKNFAQELLSDNVSQFDRQAMKKMKAAGRLLSDKMINGGYITGITVEAMQSGAYVDALVSSSGYMDSDRDGPGSIKYTHTGTFLQFRAPGDKTYGPQVACAADGDFTLYSDNPSKWIKVTLDVSDATADAERMVRFTSTTSEFNGLAKLCPAAQIRASVGAAGDAISFSILDEMIDRLKVINNPAFIMNAALRRKVLALLRSGGGVDTLTLASGVQVPAYNGIPILRNDWIPSTEVKSATTLSSIYLASLAGEEGVYMGALGGASMNVEGDPRDAAVLGFRLFDLGQIQSGAGSARGGRLCWYGAMGLGSELAIVRASELVTA